MNKIDFHAHILPGADHGSADPQTTVEQLRLARAAAVDTVVATPHFYPDRDTLELFLARRNSALRALSQCKLHDAPSIALGAEVHLCAGLEMMEGLEELCICGTKVILLELPFQRGLKGVLETVLRLQDDPRFVPVLAHVDRYRPDVIEELFAEGVLGQVNAEGLCRWMGRRKLRSWVAQGHIVALGSDIHGTHVGYRPYEKALKLLGDSGKQVMASAEALLAGAKRI